MLTFYVLFAGCWKILHQEQTGRVSEKSRHTRQYRHLCCGLRFLLNTDRFVRNVFTFSVWLNAAKTLTLWYSTFRMFPQRDDNHPGCETGVCSQSSTQSAHPQRPQLWSLLQRQPLCLFCLHRELLWDDQNGSVLLNVAGYWPWYSKHFSWLFHFLSSCLLWCCMKMRSFCRLLQWNLTQRLKSLRLNMSECQTCIA